MINVSKFLVNKFKAHVCVENKHQYNIVGTCDIMLSVTVHKSAAINVNN